MCTCALVFDSNIKIHWINPKIVMTPLPFSFFVLVLQELAKMTEFAREDVLAFDTLPPMAGEYCVMILALLCFEFAREDVFALLYFVTVFLRLALLCFNTSFTVF